eukprot:jgi/Tetstr1/461228/TSEL_000582.t1
MTAHLARGYSPALIRSHVNRPKMRNRGMSLVRHRRPSRSNVGCGIATYDETLKSYVGKLSQFTELSHNSENINPLEATTATIVRVQPLLLTPSEFRCPKYATKRGWATISSDVNLDYIDPNALHSSGAWFFTFGHIAPLSHLQVELDSATVAPFRREPFRVISFRRARQRTMDRCRLQETALAARPVTRTLRLHPFSPLQSHRARQAPQGHYHNQGH